MKLKVYNKLMLIQVTKKTISKFTQYQNQTSKNIFIGIYFFKLCAVMEKLFFLIK